MSEGTAASAETHPSSAVVCHVQASAGCVCTNAEATSFWLNEEQQAVLADEMGPDASPFFTAGAQWRLKGSCNSFAMYRTCSCCDVMRLPARSTLPAPYNLGNLLQGSLRWSRACWARPGARCWKPSGAASALTTTPLATTPCALSAGTHVTKAALS